MKVYNYAPMTGEYLGETDADPSPLEEGQFLIPAAGTTVKPPEAGENEVAAWNGNEWVLTPDYRNEVYYSKETAERVYFNLGESPNEDVTTLQRTDSAAVWNETVDVWQIPIDVLIASKRESITAERTNRIAQSTVYFKGKYFDSDRTTQNNLSNLLLAVSSGIYPETSVIWRTADDQNITLAVSELPELGALMLNETNTLYQISWDLKDQLTEIASMDYDDAVSGLDGLIWP